MGTKNNPGDFDCYANADPDEPMFILLGRDDRAPALVEAWADASEARGTNAAKVAEARQCAANMRTWREDRAAAEGNRSKVAGRYIDRDGDVVEIRPGETGNVMLARYSNGSIGLTNTDEVNSRILCGALRRANP